jgi:hypothetical protein
MLAGSRGSLTLAGFIRDQRRDGRASQPQVKQQPAATHHKSERSADARRPVTIVPPYRFSRGLPLQACGQAYSGIANVFLCRGYY